MTPIPHTHAHFLLSNFVKNGMEYSAVGMQWDWNTKWWPHSMSRREHGVKNCAAEVNVDKQTLFSGGGDGISMGIEWEVMDFPFC